MSISRKGSSDDDIFSNRSSNSSINPLETTKVLIKSLQENLLMNAGPEPTDSTWSSLSKIQTNQYGRFYLKHIDSDDETDLTVIDSKSNTPREEEHFNNDIHRSKSDSELLKDDEGHNIHLFLNMK